MIYYVTINDKKYEVEVERGKAEVLSIESLEARPQKSKIHLTSSKSEVTKNESSPAHTKEVFDMEESGEGELIKSPMPGTILKVIKPGAQVQKGDILIVLEAMKMENEILAPRDGVINKLFVNESSNVNTEDPLLYLK